MGWSVHCVMGWREVSVHCMKGWVCRGKCQAIVYWINVDEEVNKKLPGCRAVLMHIDYIWLQCG